MLSNGLRGKAAYPPYGKIHCGVLLGKGSGRFAFPGRSHLSPDGGSVTRAAVHRLAADGYGKSAK
jgi:hypothetical protein